MIAQNQTISSHEPDILSRLRSEVDIMFEKQINFIHYVSRWFGWFGAPQLSRPDPTFCAQLIPNRTLCYKNGPISYITYEMMSTRTTIILEQ